MGNEFAHPDFVDLPSEANGATLSSSDHGKRERERGDRGMSGKHFFSQVGNGRPEGSPNIIIIII